MVTSNALDDARARVASIGGTLGEQLVTSGILTDDQLTDFYRARLLVPQVNPNTLARLAPKVVATIPSDMAIELRSIPVSLDRDNNLTVAMSDPSDRHAVDEIAFFTGAYVVRAVATQMQIAWCLAHYYGHVTALGQRLLHATESTSPIKAAISAATARPARTKGLTGKVDAARHRAIAPITGPVNVVRPHSGELDLRPLGQPDPSIDLAVTPVDHGRITPVDRGGDTPIDLASTQSSGPVMLRPSPPSPRATPTSGPTTSPLPQSNRMPAVVPNGALRASASGSSPAQRAPGSGPIDVPSTAARNAPTSGSLRAASPIPVGTPSGIVPPAAPDAPTLPPGNAEPAPAESTPVTPSDGSPDRPRARSISGEIRVPSRRAASIRPPMPEPEVADDDDDEPVIVIERAATAPGSGPTAGGATAASGTAPLHDELTGPRKLPPRRRAVKSDPPELYARAGEVDLKQGDDRPIDADEPRIVIDEDALAPQTQRIATRSLRKRDTGSSVPVDPLDDADTGAVIHARPLERSEPVLLDRPRPAPSYRTTTTGVPITPLPKPDLSDAGDDLDTGEVVLELAARKPSSPTPRPERRTQVGIPPAPVIARPHRDTEATGVPAMLDHGLDRTVEVAEDPTMIDLRAAPGRADTNSSDQLAAPPSPMRDDDTNPHLLAPPPKPAPPRPAVMAAAVIVEDDEEDEDDGEADDDTGVRPAGEDDDDHEPDLELDTGEILGPREAPGPRTSVMSTVELDAAVPQRTAQLEPAHLTRRRIDYDPIDDGWGPPGTTIPPPLLGAIPGSEDDEAPSVIPMPSVDSSPLLVGPSAPSPSSAAGDTSGGALVRALEDATARAIDVIRQLEHARTRDDVVGIMISHLAETHHRAGFFVTRPGAQKSISELGLFSMTPKPQTVPFATLRLDRPSTLQDVVGTRLPYRGPMHDDASRSFLISILGACPAEILLVPVAVRERVVGVLFGEHRQRHTFDDQLALAARAAGMALERILKAKRG